MIKVQVSDDDIGDLLWLAFGVPECVDDGASVEPEDRLHLVRELVSGADLDEHAPLGTGLGVSAA